MNSQKIRNRKNILTWNKPKVTNALQEWQKYQNLKKGVMRFNLIVVIFAIFIFTLFLFSTIKTDFHLRKYFYSQQFLISVIIFTFIVIIIWIIGCLRLRSFPLNVSKLSTKQIELLGISQSSLNQDEIQEEKDDYNKINEQAGKSLKMDQFSHFFCSSPTRINQKPKSPYFTPYNTKTFQNSNANQNRIQNQLKFTDKQNKVQGDLQNALTAQQNTGLKLEKYKPSPLPVKHEEKKSTGIQSASQVLVENEINERSFENWIQKLREWIGINLVQQITTNMKNLDNEFTKENIEELKSTHDPYMLISNMTNLNQNNPLIQKRIQIEKYLHVRGFNCHEYIIQRIQNLAQNRYISEYKWNSGSNWNGIPFSNDKFPTDSQIIAHVFFTYLDFLVPAFNEKDLFSTNHFVTDENLINNQKLKSGVVLYQSKKNPPHFDVVVKGKIWNSFPGSKNLFASLVLFLFAIKKYNNGHIGQINLSDKSINLLSIFR
ncbi:hypothetical protein M0811_00545 [Anaeramoeba ignava]|uniref:Transmembrane protein n=1 Tax=Anaeramoeba ignava TaxID=1746090 RepID=A0A9Q0LTZ6_ANAIG|nr:hypothetical protein M0811_00545 [Anaeramoeba ignava]